MAVVVAHHVGGGGRHGRKLERRGKEVETVKRKRELASFFPFSLFFFFFSLRQQMIVGVNT